MSDIALLCTLGPASLNERTIIRLSEIGATLFRINLSHTPLEKLGDTIRFVQEHTSVPVCIDTEGAQVRTGPLSSGQVTVRENRFIVAHDRPVAGDADNISLYPHYIVGQLKEGDVVSIDFNSVLVQVVERHPHHVVMRVLNGGVIGQNKAVTIDRAIAMPPLTEKDVASLKLSRELGIRHVALSFANCADDVREIRRQAGDDATIISKIECRNGLTNLEAITRLSDAVLIDRGDLSREIPIERIPAIQKMIVQRAKKVGGRVYVATNLLESMITLPAPTRAEVNDIYNTLLDGVDGLVLAAETAIGSYPIACANMVRKLIGTYAKPMDDDDFYPDDSASLLVDPHGGMLVHRVSQEFDPAGLPRVAINDDELIDAEQIALGTYSPLTGFMDRETLESVLERNRLPSGLPWTMPIVLPVDNADARRFAPGTRIVLTDQNGKAHSLLDVSENYTVDLADVMRRWFGTDSSDHPGVARFTRRGNCFIAGDITLIEGLPLPLRRYDLPPARLRRIFAHKGWTRVVGFHGRNLVHRAHEHIQREALERTHADGLFINPVIGTGKAGDFLPEVILAGYQAMLDAGLYPPERVVLGAFATYPRYAGPREAVFTALCRKNMGCSHFIIGRDHAGVGDFYAPDAARDLFETLGDVGITPVFFDAVAYDKNSDAYLSTDNGAEGMSISGTEIREALVKGDAIPEWMMRPVVQDVVRERLAAGSAVFRA